MLFVAQIGSISKALMHASIFIQVTYFLSTTGITQEACPALSGNIIPPGSDCKRVVLTSNGWERDFLIYLQK